MGCALYEERFWDRVWVEKDAQLEQFGSSRMSLLHLCKRHSEGSSDRMRMPRDRNTAPIKQRRSLFSVEVKVLRQTTWCFFDVSPSLVECQREPV